MTTVDWFTDSLEDSDGEGPTDCSSSSSADDDPFSATESNESEPETDTDDQIISVCGSPLSWKTDPPFCWESLQIAEQESDLNEDSESDNVSVCLDEHESFCPSPFAVDEVVETANPNTEEGGNSDMDLNCSDTDAVLEEDQTGFANNSYYEVSLDQFGHHDRLEWLKCTRLTASPVVKNSSSVHLTEDDDTMECTHCGCFNWRC